MRRIFTLLLAVCMVAAGCASNSIIPLTGVEEDGEEIGIGIGVDVEEVDVEVEVEIEVEAEEIPQSVSIRLVAAGDNLIHDNIYQQAAARTGGTGYDFAPAYRNIARYISAADVAFINQETIIAEREFPLAGYPLFNSPEEAGNEMERMGFNIVCISNNHMFDMGERGLIAALDFWQSKEGILTIGAWRQESDMLRPLLFESRGITIGFVPITEHTNGLWISGDSPIRYIRSDEFDLMKEQIKLANEHSDFTVVSIHWGTENSNNINPNQLMLAQMFADWGADLIIGHHSHTLQPMEWRTGQSGNRTLVAYSLGNLISSMINPQNMLGGILDIEITKDFGSGITAITDAAMIPIVTQYDGPGRREVRVYPFSEYTGELVAQHGMKLMYGNFGINYLRGIIEQNIPGEFLREPFLGN